MLNGRRINFFILSAVPLLLIGALSLVLGKKCHSLDLAKSLFQDSNVRCLLQSVDPARYWANTCLHLFAGLLFLVLGLQRKKSHAAQVE